MTVGYYTDNSVSQAVMRAFSRGGVKVAHIEDFDPFNIDNPVFYGILRGTGAAMRHLSFLGEKFWYLDNGYFDAIYMDEKKQKDMSGKYRVVKEDMVEVIDALPTKIISGPMRVLMMPPSPYTAFMYDTTPEDWNFEWWNALTVAGHSIEVREKTAKGDLEKVLSDFDAVFAFNSISVMKALEMGKAVFTTHGVIRNSELLAEGAPYYNFDAIKKFYDSKNFTLEQISDLGEKCLT